MKLGVKTISKTPPWEWPHGAGEDAAREALLMTGEGDDDEDFDEDEGSSPYF